MLVRVNADPDRRAEILEAANIFDATAVDVGTNTITFEIVGEPARIADFFELMKVYGITSLVKSGRIAMAKDSKLATQKGNRKT
jgi:acetolactate synthase-1/3 small subunit